jgi:hypothetical protein
MSFELLKSNSYCPTCEDISGNYITVNNPCACVACLGEASFLSSPSYRYQNLKRIQNTVRVDSSQYTMNLGSVNSYDRETTWNKMSDRFVRSVQKGGIQKKLIPSWRPGCLTPGGNGCDIKHNSYQRHLNRLKGNKILRAQKIPPEMALPYIPFNRANPIYGDKLCKTSIINCFCR